MKPAPFAYADPDTLDGVLAALADEREVAVIAGGQSLVPLLNLRLARPDLVVDPRRVPGLTGIDVADGIVRIGALTTAAAVADDARVAELVPGLVEAVRCIGHPPIRNRTTIGGSLAHADPVAELPTAMVGLDATIELASLGRGRRSVPAGDFFTGPFATAREADELVVSVTIPVPTGSSGWLEHARRPGDFALVGAFVSLTVDPSATVADAAVAVAGLAGTPLRLGAVDAQLVGHVFDRDAIDRAVTAVAATEPPPADAHGSGDHRVALAADLVRRLLTRMLP